jgi:hypothetical protein
VAASEWNDLETPHPNSPPQKVTAMLINVNIQTSSWNEDKEFREGPFFLYTILKFGDTSLIGGFLLRLIQVVQKVSVHLMITVKNTQ